MTKNHLIVKMRKHKKNLKLERSNESKNQINKLKKSHNDLTTQNIKSASTQTEINKLHSNHSDLYYFAPVGYFTFDQKGTILEVNPAGADLLSAEKNDLINKKFSRFITSSFKNIYNSHCKKVFETKTQQTCELKIQNKNSTQLYIQMKSFIVKNHDENLSLFRSVITDITVQKHTEEELRKLTLNLNKRVKELNCLYSISKLVENQNISLEEIIQETVNFIPSAMQYPEITYARIILMGKEFKTEIWKDTLLKYTTKIVLKGKHVGTLEVCCLEEKQERTKRYFLKEEKNLIKAITERLGRIIERKQAEKQLEEERIFIEKTINAQMDTFFVFDPANGKAIRWNKIFKIASGYTDEEISSLKAPDSYYSKEDLKRAQKATKKIIKEGKATLELSLITKDGRSIPTEYQGSVINDEKGKPKYIIAIGRDISERKKNENILKESEERYRDLVEKAGIAILIDDENGNLKYFNNKFQQLFGYSREEMKNQSIYSLTHPDDVRKVMKYHKQRVSGKKAQSRYDFKGIKKDGTTIYLEVDAVPLKEGNTIVGTRSYICDITERKQTEEKLRKSDERYTLAQRAANIGSWDWNIKTGTLHWSDRIEPIFGFKRGEFNGTIRGFLQCVYPEDRKHVIDSINACINEGKYYSIEHRIVWPDKTIHWVLEKGNVIRDKNRKAIRMLGIVQDITKHKQTDDRQKLATQILNMLNQSSEKTDKINDILLLIKEFTGIEAIGIRLKEKEDFPYYRTYGFSENFIESENYLCERNQKGEIIRDSEGNPVLACMCGNIIRGRTDPFQSFFTENGSFWTNSTTELLASTTETERLMKTRNRCNEDGYESVALIPLRYNNEIVGLLQLNDKRNDMFSIELINFFEAIGSSIGIALTRKRAEEVLIKAHHELESRVQERTAELSRANIALQAEIAERKHYQEQLRSLASESLKIEEKERRRIAAGLHDRIVQTLAVSKIKLSSLYDSIFSPELLEHIKEISEHIDQTIQETRTLTFELSPPVLYELGLVPALHWLAEQLLEKHNLSIKITDDKLPKPLHDNIRIVLFQTVRELLINIIKHAQAKNIKISIKRNQNKIKINVKDDGIGFDTSKIHVPTVNRNGFGLFNIRERLDYLGGHFEIESQINHGTQVLITAPLKPGDFNSQ